MNKKIFKIALLTTIATLSYSLNAQHVIGTVRAIDIKADTDQQGGLEGIRFYAANKRLAEFNPSNNIFVVRNFFEKESYFQGKAYFHNSIDASEPAIFRKKTSIYSDLTVSGISRFWSNIGIGIASPQEGLHLKDKNVRVDGGGYQSWGPIVLHPDVDKNGDDIVSFRNSQNSEMAKLHDGVLTLNFNSSIHSPGMLSIRPGTSNSQEDIISFKNGSNQEMATLQDGVLTLDQIRLNVTTFPDYVFASNYTLMPLDKVASFIKTHKHLPNMPSEKEVIKEGMNVGQINTILVEKVEELTLYTIAQEAKIKKQDKALKLLEERLVELEKLQTTKK
ncbi:hypothetical protein [Tenacibaculum sp. nBUS_03]|uniref:hypothetical protein n=1 Tax=Tenacibaculum sp. nBUS_03 TaxID=3395320 RepID=UPI003EB83AC7